MLENDLKDTEKSFTMEDDISDIITVLKGSMWEGVTIQMILDMTVNIDAGEYSSCGEPDAAFAEYMQNIANAPKDEYGFIQDKGAIDVPDDCREPCISATYYAASYIVF